MRFFRFCFDVSVRRDTLFTELTKIYESPGKDEEKE